MSKEQTLNAIRECLRQHLPATGKAVLFGSQARNTARSDSDWDILITLNKKDLTPEDYDKVSFPLTLLGWNLGEKINPIMYTTREWQSNQGMPFYKNVEKEGITL